MKLIFALALTLSSNVFANTSLLPKVKSGFAYAVLLPSNKIVYEKDADVQRPIASLSKLMSALTLREICKIDDDTLHEMTIPNRMAAKGGDHSKLNTGWMFSRKSLLTAALLRSDNRAMPALVESCGMSLDVFAQKMNLKAKNMGLTKTQFVEPNGLSPLNVSTAREYSKILEEMLKNQDLMDLLQTKKTTVWGFRQGIAREIEIKSTDKLLLRDNINVLGGKTGYTDLARYCFGGVAELPDKQRIAMVFLQAEGSYTRFADFLRLYNWLAPTTASNKFH